MDFYFLMPLLAWLLAKRLLKPFQSAKAPAKEAPMA